MFTARFCYNLGTEVNIGFCFSCHIVTSLQNNPASMQYAQSLAVVSEEKGLTGTDVIREMKVNNYFACQ